MTELYLFSQATHFVSLHVEAVIVRSDYSVVESMIVFSVFILDFLIFSSENIKIPRHTKIFYLSRGLQCKSGDNPYFHRISNKLFIYQSLYSLRVVSVWARNFEWTGWVWLSDLSLIINIPFTLIVSATPSIRIGHFIAYKIIVCWYYMTLDRKSQRHRWDLSKPLLIRPYDHLNANVGTT